MLQSTCAKKKSTCVGITERTCMTENDTDHMHSCLEVQHAYGRERERFRPCVKLCSFLTLFSFLLINLVGIRIKMNWIVLQSGLQISACDTSQAVITLRALE